MSSEYGMPKLEAKVKANLETAYNALRMAGEDMDIIDFVAADRIRTVRKQALKLLQELL